MLVSGPVRRGAALLLAFGVLLLTPSLAAGAVVANGGFETPAANGSTVFSAPASLGGWSVDSGTVVLADASAWTPAAGSQSLGLYATPTISQTVDVDPGTRYRLSVRHADGPPPPGPGYIPCSDVVGAQPIQVFWGDDRVGLVPGSGHRTDDWQSFTHSSL